MPTLEQHVQNMIGELALRIARMQADLDAKDEQIKQLTDELQRTKQPTLHEVAR